MPEPARCAVCGRVLTRDEIGASKKLINRGLSDADCLCLPCLAGRFRVDEAVIEKKIRQWREQGCVLFDPLQENPPSGQ